MNQTSLSVSDVGKTNVPLQAGVGESKGASDSSESGSFLSALGAIFRSETESTDKTQASTSEVSDVELSDEGNDELAVSDSESVEEAEDLADESSKALSTSSASDDVLLQSESSDPQPEEQQVAKTMSEGNELLGRLDESNQALKKVGGNDLPLQTKSDPASTDSPDEAALSRFTTAAVSQKSSDVQDESSALITPTATSTQPEDSAALNHKTSSNVISEKALSESDIDALLQQQNAARLANQKLDSESTTKQMEELTDDELRQLSSENKQGKRLSVDEQAVMAANAAPLDSLSSEAIASEELSRDALSAQTLTSATENSDELASQTLTSGTLSSDALSSQIQSSKTESSLEQSTNPLYSQALSPEQLSAETIGAQTNIDQTTMQIGDELVWDDGQTTDATLASQAMLMASAGMVNGTAASEVSRADIESTMAALNLTDVSVEELTAEELEYLVQLSAANAMPEQLKASVDLVKPTAVATATAQQLQTPQHLQQSMAQTQALDKAATAAQMQNLTAEQNAAQLPQMQMINSAPLMTASNANSQQQLMKTALAASGVAGAASGLKASDKSDNKESSLSQQLSGLAAQQGTQQAQIKADAIQATQQTPLHLTREAASEKLSEQIQMMMSKNLKNIDIRLDPPELGRMHIRMTMSGDTAAVQFTVANQQARDLVDQAMPRLREMLAQQGIQLSDSSVHQQNGGQQQNQYADNDGNHSSGTQGRNGNSDLNVDESINLDLNIKSKDDGISYYA